MDSRIKSIEFIEDKHEYWFTDEQGRHRRLHGVTGVIGKLMGKSFPDTDTVRIATMYGHDVHKSSEMWIKEGREPSTEGGKWLVGMLEKFAKENGVAKYLAELLVSDFIGTASCIDIVAIHEDGKATLFDIKTTSRFDRPYCSLQLSCYKKLFEACYGMKVEGMYVLATKPKRLFKILEQEENRVQKILDMNK